MKDLLIRTATVEDAAALLDIYRYYVEKTAITFEYEVPAVAEFEHRVATTLQKYPYLVAVMEDKIVGYAYVSAFKSRAAYDWSVETSIYVAQGMMKEGIGKKLYARLEEILKEMHITNVNACIAYPEVEDEYLNFNSVQFHEHLGYKLVGQFHNCAYKFDKWYHMVWMEKMIGEHTSPMPNIIPFPELSKKD